MMNGVALLLILGSVISGSVWSPKLSQNNQNPNIIIKKGHSVVVIEYVRDGEGKESNTKISIYPKDYYDGLKKVGEAKEDVNENVGSKMKEVVGERISELKHGVAKVKEVVGEGSNKVKDGADKIKEVVSEGSTKVRDAVHKVIESDMMDTPKRALEDVKSNLSNLADIDRIDIEEFVCDAAGKCKHGLEKAEGATKEGVTKGVGKVKEVAAKVEDVIEKAKDSVAWDMPRRAVEDIQRNVSMIGDTMRETNRMNSFMGVVRVVQLLGISLSFGMSMWMTFVSCYILGDDLPREQFGMLHSRLYPIYYKIQAYCTGVALMAHLFSRSKKIVSSSAESFYSINLIISLLMSFGNFLYLEPKATQIMSERFKVEKEEGREGVTSHPKSGIADGDPVSATTEQQEEVKAETHTARLSEKLKMINRISSYANIVTLISLSMHMVYLGLQIQVLKMKSQD